MTVAEELRLYPSHAACLASLLIYGLAFGFIMDRPLALGFLRHQLDSKLARAASLHGPKLVILAGSTAPTRIAAR